MREAHLVKSVWVEFQSANLCFLRFSLAVCSYLEASRDKNWKSKRHRLVDRLMFHCSSLLLSLFGLKEGRWEWGGKFASCCLVLGRKKSFLHMAEGLENPRVFEWESNMLGLHATLVTWSISVCQFQVDPLTGCGPKVAVMIRAMWASTYPRFPTYLWDTPPPSLCLGPLPWQMTLIYY